MSPLVLDILGDRTGTAPVAGEAVQVAEILTFHRLGGLGCTWATRAGEVGRELAEALEPIYRRQQLAGAVVQESAARALEALESAEIPALMFKGAALVSAGLYADTGERPMDDADLLVPQDRAYEASSVLANAGFSPWAPWQPGRDGWSDSFTLRDTEAPPALACDIDLHWRTEGVFRLRHFSIPEW